MHTEYQVSTFPPKRLGLGLSSIVKRVITQFGDLSVFFTIYNRRFLCDGKSLLIIVPILLIFVCTNVFLCDVDFHVDKVMAQSMGIEPGETNDQPKVRSTTVSASVPDIIPPSVPILISPVNLANLTNSQVVFVFDGSNDNVGIDRYQFWLDGELLFANLNPAGEITTQYSLSVIGNQYTFIPTLAQVDGAHTWKVVAVDAANNQTSSATWQFTLDSRAPTFLITNVDNQVYSISTQDLQTIPSTPISVTSAQPFLSGTGEANSSGVAAVVISGQPTQIITFTISGSGTWQVQLPTLPYDVIITLNFTITDLAGNVSVLSDLKLIRPRSPAASPAPTAILISGTPYPTPSVIVIPGTTIPFPSPPPLPFPLPDLPLPIPSPIQSLVEQITRLGQTPRALLAQMMPDTLVATWYRPGLSSQNILLMMFSVLNWLWLLLPVVICLIWLSRYLPKALSWTGLRQLWWAVGMGKQPQPQGVVVGLPNLRLLPFATLTTISVLPNGQKIISYRISNRWGEYLPANLSAGTHQVVIDYEGYLFPAVFNIPSHVQFSSYYLGETWKTNEQVGEPKLIIPLLEAGLPPRHTPPDWLLNLSHHQGKSSLIQIVIMLVTAMFLPSLPNVLAILTLGCLITRCLIKQSKLKRRKAIVYNRLLKPVSVGAVIIRGQSSCQQVSAIYHGQLSQVMTDQILSDSPHSCQALTNQNQQIKITEDICSIQRDQIAI